MAGAVLQAVGSFGEEPVAPFADGLGVDLEPLGGLFDRPTADDDAVDHVGDAAQRRLLVTVGPTAGRAGALGPAGWSEGHRRSPAWPLPGYGERVSMVPSGALVSCQPPSWIREWWNRQTKARLSAVVGPPRFLGTR